MAIKIRNLSRWSLLKAGEAIVLPGPNLRRVRLEFNVEAPTRFDVLQDGKTTFLTVLEPIQCPAVVEFIAEGECSIVPTTEGEVWWFTDDGELIHHAISTESFTKLEQRMERTPELEITMLKAQLRSQQRLAEQRRLLLEAQTAHDPETGEVIEDEEEPADDHSGEPSEGDGTDAPASEQVGT